MVFGVLCTIALAAAIFQVTWKNKLPYYLEAYSEDGAAVNNMTHVQLFFVTLGTWILLSSSLIPISLLVTIEIVHFLQALCISWDALIYSVEKDMSTKVQSNNLNEELGQIDYIFSDKTGTLTENIMEFRIL